MRLSIEAVSFTYPTGVRALKDICLGIESGEAIALVGENGAGKTTLVKHFNGLLKPKTGRVLVGDWDTSQHSTAHLAQRVGYVFQNPDDQLFERNVWKEVAFGPRNLGLSDSEVEKRVENALELVALSDQADHHPYDLHASQRKLVAIAATIAMDTPVVILDEPTTGQDAVGMARIGVIVDSLKSAGYTVIAISHDLDFCSEHFKRMVVMSEGTILADGPISEILLRPELLRQAAVEPPQLVRLALALGYDQAPRTPAEFVTAYAHSKGPMLK